MLGMTKLQLFWALNAALLTRVVLRIVTQLRGVQPAVVLWPLQGCRKRLVALG